MAGETLLVELRHAIFGYRDRAVVSADSVALREGRCLGIFGPNGSGKTTLVRGITGLLAPSQGQVVRHNEIRFGYLPQHRAIEAHWPMSGLDAASLATSANCVVGWLRRGTAKVREMMRLLGVEELASRPFSKLSGGQQQRLLLAGALATEPHVLVLDEPTDGLDLRSRDVLLDALRRSMSRGLCAAVISHDVEDLLALANEIAWVHPSDQPDAPSRVEVVPPDSFAGRILHSRRTA
jgi:ABC-type Mn2+/Zn2+ transport system ATPase subunit